MKPAASKLSGPRFSKPARSFKVGSFLSVSGFRQYARLIVAATLLSCHVTSCTGQGLQNDLSEKILTSTGETVILPCHITVRDDLPTVEWSKEGLDPNITFLYRDGCETFEMKNKVFQYRTNLIMNKLKDGNISLIISNVQLTDAGKYQCVVVQKKNRRVVKTLELVVGAVSEPKLSVVPGVGRGVTLQCEANCWFPEPEVTFVDAQGNSISAENPKRDQDSRGCFTVTRRVTVQTAPNRVTCRVHEPQMNKTRDKEIYHIPGNCIITGSIAVLVTLFLLGLGACACFFLRKSNVGRKMSGQSSGQSTTPGNAGVHHRNQADNNENATAKLQRRIEELENQLHDKDELNHKLTEELNHLRSRQGPVLQHGQPTIVNSPSTSSPDVSKPINHPLHQFPHDNNTEPPASASSDHTKSGNLPRKDSKRGVPRQNPAVGLPAQTGSHSNSSPALFTNNGAMSSNSSSSSSSEEKYLVRTKSESRPRPNVARISRRNTISAMSYTSHNRFRILENLPEESEMLLSCEEK